MPKFVTKFPLAVVIVSFIVGASLILLSVEKLDPMFSLFLNRSIMALLVFLMLSTAVTLVCEKVKMKKERKVLLYLAAALFPLVFSQSIDFGYNSYWLGLERTAEVTKFLAVLLASFAFVFFVPSLFTKDRIASWGEISSRVKAFVLASIISGAAFVGIVIALVAIQSLFSNLNPRLWGSVAVVILFGLNSLIFLGLMSSSDNTKTEPLGKVLERFAKLVLIPLHLVYTAIIYLYAFTFIIYATLPSNQIAPLMLFFTVTGFIAISILYPLWIKKTDRVTNYYFRFYGLSLIPVAFIYFYSLLVRVGEFGLTPDRILALIIGGFMLLLAGMLLYKKTFRLDVFATLVAAIVIASFSLPIFNINNIARLSLESRFISRLEELQIIRDGKVFEQTTGIDSKSYYAIENDFLYIGQNFSLDFLKPYLSTQEQGLLANRPRYGFLDQIFGIKPAPVGSASRIEFSVYFNSDEELNVSGFDLVVGGQSVSIYPGGESNKYKMKFKDELYDLDLNEYVQAALPQAYGQTDAAKRSVVIDSDDLKNYTLEIKSDKYARLVYVPRLIHAVYKTEEGKFHISVMQGSLLVKN